MLENSNYESEKITQELPNLNVKGKHMKLLMGMSNGLIISSISLTYLFFPPLAHSRGISQFIIGLIFSTELFISFLVSLFLAKKLYIVGKKRVLLAGYILMSISMFIFAMINFIENVWIFLSVALFSRLIGGLAVVCGLNVILSYVPQLFPNDEVEETIGLMESASGMGYLIGPLIGSILYISGNYNVPFIAFAIAIVILAPFLLKNLPADDNYKPADGKLHLYKAVSNFKIISILLGILYSGFNVTYLETSLTNHYMLDFNIAPKYIGFVSATPVFISIIGNILFGKIPKWIDRKLFLFLGILGFSIANLFIGPSKVIPFPNSAYLSIFGVFLIGLFYPLILIPTIIELINEIEDSGIESNPKAINDISSCLYNGFSSLGSSIGPIFGGYLQNNISFRHSYEIFSGIGIIILTFFILKSGFIESAKRGFKSNRNLEEEGIKKSEDEIKELLI